MDISTDPLISKDIEQNSPHRKRRFFLSLLSFLGLLGVFVGVSAVIAYKSMPSIADINKCFTTSMFKVHLCESNPGYVRYKQFPKHLVAALITAEDSTFFFHKGFDWDEIRDSLEKSLDAGRWVRGGSTITQQLAKNLYLSKEKSLQRKLKEFFIAKQIEEKLKKEQIIEKYLNVVEFGKGIYGINKAAFHYFGKSVSSLSPAESAYLVSLLPNPVKYSSAFHARKELSRFNKNRVGSILNLMRIQGKISEDEFNYETARTEIGLWTPYDPEIMFMSDDGTDLDSDEPVDGAFDESEGPFQEDE